MSSSPRASTEQSSTHSDANNGPLTSTPQSLSRAVHARRAEYTRARKIKVKIGSWNVNACAGTEKDLRGWFVEGKGIDDRLSGIKITDGSQDHIESVDAQEQRRSKKESTIPRGDEGTIVGGDQVDIYVLGLQEVVDLNSAREYLGRVYTDSEPATTWRKALVEALPKGYIRIVEEQLSGLLLFVFASPEVAATISNVSTVSVGTGFMGYLGNKGGITSRLILGETTRMVFVNSHLSSGTDAVHVDRRCWDVSHILQKTQFSRISWAGVLDDTQEGIGDGDFAFWFGDLNFRLDGLPGDDIRRLLMLHTKDEYRVGESPRDTIDHELGDTNGTSQLGHAGNDSDSDDDIAANLTQHDAGRGDGLHTEALRDPDDFEQDPHQDPMSLQATLDSLLPHDQLRQVQKNRKAFHDGWREGPITFLPTYKYDVGSMGMFDSSEKKRAPSWCDRILFRTRKDKLLHDTRDEEALLAKLKDEEMKARGIDHAGDDEDVLFNRTTDEDGADDGTNNDYDEYDEGEDDNVETIVTKEGYLDRIQQDVYTSHQRVLSSDHKPLDSVFTIEYDAVVPELKAKIQAEVARELDRAENEGRPGITVVVDHSADDTSKVDSKHKGATSDGADAVEFGNVAYLQRISRNLTIANTSQVDATIAFVDRPSPSGEERVAPPWLSISFLDPETDGFEHLRSGAEGTVVLCPGDTVNVALELCVDKIAHVRDFNEGATTLDDVLVLRVTNGRDYFIPLRGSWLQSCLSRTIDELIRIPEGGVRALLPRPAGQKGGPINRGQEVCWSAPRELFKLTDTMTTLAERVVADAEVLETAQIPQQAHGWPFSDTSWLQKDASTRETQKRCVLEALDSDTNLNASFPPETPAIERFEIVAEVLLLFTSSLIDGLVPSTIWTQLAEDIHARASQPLPSHTAIKTWVLDVLSSEPHHHVALVFLTSMLSRVAGELAPVPKSADASEAKAGSIRSIRSGFGSVRRSLSWKGKGPVVPDFTAAAAPAAASVGAPEVKRREGVERAWAEVWAREGVVFRGGAGGDGVSGKGRERERERRAVEERRREIMEAFIRGERA